MHFRHQHKLGLIFISIAISTLAHFALAESSHELHVIHIVLAGTFLLPVIAAAIWFPFLPLSLITAAISIIYYIYMRVRWDGRPMENANQFAFIAGFWIVAIIAGLLMRQKKSEEARHRASELIAERRSTIEALDSLSEVLRARDEYTREHSEHVAHLAARVAQRIGLSEEQIELVRLAGLVHDIGKVGIRDDVLFKPAALTQKERKLIEQHPKVAADILAKIPSARPIASVVLAHHECPDGSGYPSRLKEQAIPIEAHILRVADVFCSLVEIRPYKSGLGVDAALKTMRSWSGSKIHADSFSALLEVLSKRGNVESNAKPHLNRNRVQIGRVAF